MKKALLILVGGRPIPNVLTAVHESPAIVVAICSRESFKEEWLQLRPALETLLPAASIEEEEAVDAYDVHAITTVCERALVAHPDAEWIVNVTTGTSLMTHGAYVAAERCSKQGMAITCWFLDTGHRRVIPLLGASCDARIFSLSVQQYITAYNYRIQAAGNYKNYRSDFLQEGWMKFVAQLGRHPRKIDLLKGLMDKKPDNGWCHIAKTGEEAQLVREMGAVKLISKMHEDEAKLHFYLSDQQRKFLGGAWLELYVFQEAQQTGFFDDVQWSQEIIDNDPDRKATIFKEMDVSLTCGAQLMIIECKTTGSKNFDSKILDELVTIADLVGKGAVFKILVASQFHREADGKDDFLAKARSKGVQVIAQEELPQVGALLKERIQQVLHR